MSVSEMHRLIALFVLTLLVGACAIDATQQNQIQSSKAVIDDKTRVSTIVSSAPGSVTNQTTAVFVFSNSIDGAKFECQLDDVDIEFCQSPYEVKRLQEGEHSFRVYTTIPSTNSSDEQSTNEIEVTWRIDFTAPSV